MPLKTPGAMPKIPKTRKKHPSSFLENVPQKKEDKVDYNCSVFFHYDSLLKKQFYAVRLETAINFGSFSYSITYDAAKSKKTIDIVILGLKADIDYLPGARPAMSDIMFEELFGEFTVNIIKQDGCVNSAVYDFNIFKKEILLLKKFVPTKKNNRLFCDFTVAGNLYSFSPEYDR